MEPDLPLRALAVYLHIPFCLTRCGYCSFFSLPFSQVEQDRYLGHLHSEIKLWEKRQSESLRARTLYFGGGTPSLLSADQINGICACFELLPDAEITLEINPVQITGAYLRELAKTPVNRLSLGLQSMDDTQLAWLDRRHRSAQIPARIKLCHDNGWRNLSLDLLYGLPGGTKDKLSRDLERFLVLEPEHISAYLLTLDPDSPARAKLSAPGALPLPDDDALADQYALLRETLKASGFEQYEISNFCRPGRASRHNLAYWRCEPYLGLGAGAHGYLPPWRYAHPASLPDYYGQVERGETMPAAQYCDAEQTKADYLMMGLRLTAGIDLDDYALRFGSKLQEEKRQAIAKLTRMGLLEFESHRLRLSAAALFVSTAVIGELL